MKELPIAFREIIEQSTDPICITKTKPLGQEGPEIVYVNEAYGRANPADKGGPDHLQSPITQISKADSRLMAEFREAIANHQTTQVMFNKADDGEPELWVELTLMPLTDDRGEVTHFAAIERDINNQRKLQRLLETPTGKDLLTGLPDQQGFKEILAQEFSLFSRNRQVYSVIQVDIDQFTLISNCHGEKSASRVVTDLARVIKEVFRFYDHIARIGDDRFCMLLRQTNLQQALLTSIRLRQTVQSRSFPIDEGSVNLTVSIGLSDVLSSDVNFDDVLLRSEEALHFAKSNGGDQVEMYRPERLNSAHA